MSLLNFGNFLLRKCIARHIRVFIRGKVEPGVSFSLAGDGPGPRSRQATGEHPIRAQAVQPKRDIRRRSFSQRVITTWNSLPARIA